MIIECAGTRGSIARGGEEFSKYGGDTISVRITADSGEIIIIDAGTGIQTFGNNIMDDGDTANPTPVHIFFTHYHLDHIVGIPFFKPIFNSKQKITMYGPNLEGTDGVEETFKNMMSPPYSPLSLDGHEIKASFTFYTISEEVFTIGSVTVTTIGINHTNHGGLGYKIEENGKTFILLSDNELKYPHKNGHPIEVFQEFCKDADLVFHDAQFTRSEYDRVRGWGHSTIEDVIELGTAANCKKVGLFHYAPDRTDSEVEELYGSLKHNDHPEETLFFPLTQKSTFIL